MAVKTKIYFASDFHLGTPTHAKSREREDRIVRWLDLVQEDASAIYLLGDLFDFWFEYRTVIPRGFIRLQGKLAEIADKGIPLYFFTGNHDMWMFDYFTRELGVEIYREPVIREYNGKRFYIGHGDGLGPGDRRYKFLKRFFNSSLCQRLFACLHPDLGMGIAQRWSKSSRAANDQKETFLGQDKEWLVIYAKELLKKEHFDYFVFGHRHLPLDIRISSGSRYVNLGDWLHYNSYAVFDGQDLELNYFRG
ncbi:MAG TPA: UDP-2,3-diacylglucosamine diphosphatase [Anseongella sp.]